METIIKGESFKLEIKYLIKGLYNASMEFENDVPEQSYKSLILKPSTDLYYYHIDSNKNEPLFYEKSDSTEENPVFPNYPTTQNSKTATQNQANGQAGHTWEGIKFYSQQNSKKNVFEVAIDLRYDIKDINPSLFNDGKGNYGPAFFEKFILTPCYKIMETNTDEIKKPSIFDGVRDAIDKYKSETSNKNRQETIKTDILNQIQEFYSEQLFVFTEASKDEKSKAVNIDWSKETIDIFYMFEIIKYSCPIETYKHILMQVVNVNNKSEFLIEYIKNLFKSLFSNEKHSINEFNKISTICKDNNISDKEKIELILKITF